MLGTPRHVEYPANTVRQPSSIDSGSMLVIVTNSQVQVNFVVLLILKMNWATQSWCTHLPGCAYRQFRGYTRLPTRPERGLPPRLLCATFRWKPYPGAVTEFVGIALGSIFHELLEGPNYAQDRRRGSRFSLRVPLESACIIGHCHPAITRDLQG